MILVYLLIFVILLAFCWKIRGKGEGDEDVIEGEMYYIWRTTVLIGTTTNDDFKEKYEAPDKTVENIKKLNEKNSRSINQLLNITFGNFQQMSNEEFADTYNCVKAIINNDQFAKTKNPIFGKIGAYIDEYEKKSYYQYSDSTIKKNSVILTTNPKMVGISSLDDLVVNLDINVELTKNNFRENPKAYEEFGPLVEMIKTNAGNTSQKYIDTYIILMEVIKKSKKSRILFVLFADPTYVAVFSKCSGFIPINYIEIFKYAYFGIESVVAIENSIMFGELHYVDWSSRELQYNLFPGKVPNSLLFENYLELLDATGVKTDLYLEMTTDAARSEKDSYSIQINSIKNFIKNYKGININFIFADLRLTSVAERNDIELTYEWLERNVKYFMKILYCENLLEGGRYNFLLDTVGKKFMSFSNKAFDHEGAVKYENEIEDGKVFLSRTAFEFKRLKEENIGIYNKIKNASVSVIQKYIISKEESIPQELKLRLYHVYTDMYNIAKFYRRNKNFSVFYNGSAHTNFLSSMFKELNKELPIVIYKSKYGGTSLVYGTNSDFIFPKKNTNFFSILKDFFK